jgi:hypothetical protein
MTVQGNRVGVKPDGITPLGNAGSGILTWGPVGTIGGPTESAGNVVAYNGGAGIEAWALNWPKQAAFQANSIHDNAGLGIDLGSDGVTPNDSDDADFGANLLQNFPIVTSLVPFLNGTLISGTLDSAPNSKFRIDVYASTQGDPTGYGEGQTWLGPVGGLVTDAMGSATWSLWVPYTGLGFVSATVTDFVGNTSEFGAAFSNPMEASPAGNMQVGPNGGSSLALTYAPACGAANHVVYWGQAGPGMIGGAGLSWIDSTCALGVSGAATFDPGTPPLGQAYYFAIVGHNAVQEGSYGKDSGGIERPEAVRVGACDHSQVLPQACQ